MIDQDVLRRFREGPPAEIVCRALNASPQLVALVDAMRRVAAASFSNRCGRPYYERRTAMLQLRGCLHQAREVAA